MMNKFGRKFHLRTLALCEHGAAQPGPKSDRIVAWAAAGLDLSNQKYDNTIA